jgi:hypothetical protein
MWPEVAHKFCDETNNSVGAGGIRRDMKKIALTFLAVLFLAPLVPAATAQVVVEVGHHHHHRHCWYRHHHRHCEYR